MPNIEVQDRKAAKIEVVLRDVSLLSGPNRLLDSDGASLVVHERTDDYVSDPAGNAGARIACGVISARCDGGAVRRGHVGSGEED